MTPCRRAAQIAVIMVLLARLVHWQPALAGVLTTVVLVPVTAAITRKAAHVRKRLVGLTDARVKVCTEVVSGASSWLAASVKLASSVMTPSSGLIYVAASESFRERPASYKCMHLSYMTPSVIKVSIVRRLQHHCPPGCVARDAHLVSRLIHRVIHRVPY